MAHNLSCIITLFMAAPPPSITLPSKAMVAPVLCDEDLTDDQIKQLLQQAELRLRKQSTDLRAINKPTQSLPKLDVGNITQPYIKANGGISRVDSSYLLDKHARDLADQPRKAKSNSVEKKKLAEVCDHFFSFSVLTQSHQSISIYFSLPLNNRFFSLDNGH